MTEKQCIEAMIVAGTQMSNLCYNLRNTPERAATDANIRAMSDMVRRWDAAVSSYHSVTKKPSSTASSK